MERKEDIWRGLRRGKIVKSSKQQSWKEYEDGKQIIKSEISTGWCKAAQMEYKAEQDFLEGTNKRQWNECAST